MNVPVWISAALALIFTDYEIIRGIRGADQNAKSNGPEVALAVPFPKRKTAAGGTLHAHHLDGQARPNRSVIWNRPAVRSRNRERGKGKDISAIISFVQAIGPENLRERIVGRQRIKQNRIAEKEFIVLICAR